MIKEPGALSFLGERWERRSRATSCRLRRARFTLYFDDAGVEDLSTCLSAKHYERDNYIRLCARGSISELEPDTYLAVLREETKSIQRLLDDARLELAAREHNRLVAQNARAWLLTLKDRVEEVEENTLDAYRKRRQLRKLLVSGITAGRDTDGRLDVRMTSRFGLPEASDREEVFAVGVNDTP